MKSKLAVGLLVIALLLCQGLAFAEATKDVPATAEEVIVAENPTTGAVDEAVVTDELVTPAAESAKEIKAEAKEATEEVKAEAKEEVKDIKAEEKEALKEAKM